MIIVDSQSAPSKSKPDLIPESASTDRLPTFEESTNHIPNDVQFSDSPYPFQDPPPAFSPYIASYFTHSDGSIISHDAHLNEDGEALYRFLLSHASTPPTYHLHVKGTHEEIRTRIVSSHSHDSGRHHNHDRVRTETYTEMIVDFDFRIDLTPNIIADTGFSPVQWSVHDGEPAHRGRMFQQTEAPVNPIDPHGVTTKRRASRKELNKWKFWWAERDSKGLPPWTTSLVPDTGGELRSSRTVRQWCDDYCSSNKHLKEFIYTKVVYGWDFRRMVAAIRSLIVTEAGYTEHLTIRFAPEQKASHLIIVRPTNHLSQALSNKWFKFLLVITLIYPFIWLYKRFHARGGGVWNVCGAGYPLKVVRHTPRETLVDVGTSGSARTSTAYTAEVVGEQEGAWFRRWERTIHQCVLGKRKDPLPLVHPHDYHWVNSNATILDGYREEV